jgi:hypothetical protein
MPYDNPQNVIDALWRHTTGEGSHLYAILDGARNPGIYPAVCESGAAYTCLYRGELDDDLATAAPYLLRLEKNHPFTERLATDGWGDSWGIFLRSAVDLRALRRHFRKFLMVYGPDAQPLYFRYYDPRVLRTYLPTCNAAELEIMFGPVASYMVEDEDPDIVLSLSNASGTLQTQRSRLKS